MKKIIVLFVLAVGLMSFSDDKQSSFNDSLDLSFNNSVDVEFSFDDFSIDSCDVGYRCRATVSYNGEEVASIYGYGNTAAEACADAMNRAREFVALSIQLGKY